MSLLKQETGIDVKSASSSIEEIVARQFVERQARKRRITLPSGPLFADAPVVKKTGKTGPEPPPTAPALRPRLIKTIKPAAHEEVGPAPPPATPPAPEPEPVVEVAAVPEVVEA